MNLKDQVVNLELSKKLKELGFKQESLWYYQCSIYPTNIVRKGEFKGGIIYSAYTVAELIYMLQKASKKDIMVSTHCTKVSDYLARKLIWLKEK